MAKKRDGDGNEQEDRDLANAQGLAQAQNQWESRNEQAYEYARVARWH